jgi:flavin reductase (DIM6/NTAB) family NADH-FMN oxidoreductase RutF
MYYETALRNHGLKYDPFKSCVIPRPIGWISTLSPDRIPNLAPFSQFQMLTYDPPYVMFSGNQTVHGARKDTVRNVEATGEFVWNMAIYDLREAVNKTAQDLPPEVDEFEVAGLTKAPARLVKPPMVAESPVHFECKYHQTLRLPGNGKMGTVDVVIGLVIAVHIDDAALTPEGRLDVLKIRPIARLGYYDYTSIDSRFEMIIPSTDDLHLAGLSGARSA